MRYKLLACLICFSLFAHPVFAAEAQPTEASSYAVMNMDGELLASQNADKQMAMASITKIMTAMVALDSHANLDTVVPVHKVELPAGAQAANFTGAETITYRQLMEVMLVYSANDASILIAEHCAGSVDAFVERMNAKARQLGLTNTHFMNPHGLEDPKHYSSANDLVKMGKYALDHYPFIARTVKMRSVTIPVGDTQKSFPSTDHLMGHYKGLLGIKTGKVEAGTTFLGAARRHGITLYSCVLGCKTDDGRFRDTKILLDWGFSRYPQTLYSVKGLTVAELPYLLNFQFKVPVVSNATTLGYPYLGGAQVLKTIDIPKDISSLKPRCVGVAQWTQGTRVLATNFYVVRYPRLITHTPYTVQLTHSLMRLSLIG